VNLIAQTDKRDLSYSANKFPLSLCASEFRLRVSRNER